MKLIVTVDLQREVLENIFVTAIEGGSNYWCRITDEGRKAVRTVVPKSEDVCFSTALFKAVYDHGIAVPVYDAETEGEEDDESIGEISMKSMQDRLQNLLNGPNKDDLMAEIDENGDANSSDVVFQHIALGEVVYG